MTSQTAQVVGFAAGGVLVAALGPGTALALDAATFLLAGIVLRIGLTRRDRPRAVTAGSPGGLRETLAGVTDIASDPRRRAPVLLVRMVGLYVVPEALAAP